MPKIIYTDETGNTEIINPKQPKIATIAIIAGILLLGAIGGVAGTVVAAQNPNLRFLLGLNQATNENGSTKIKTDKIVIEESSSVIDTAKKVSPAVVSISTKKNAMDFFGQIITQEGGGTGFIITSDGLIVTNKHVVSDENATYTVFTSDGKDYPAQVLARDPFQDIAVIKITANGLITLELGDSDQLQIGQMVMAVGNALGQFQNTVTTGVISAKEREIEAGDALGGSSEKLEGLLQTDAAINQGNSGGPLVNLKGQVIGINTAVAAKGQAEGIGFAIPINSIKKSIEQVKSNGKIVRAYLGVRYVAITKEIAKTNDLTVNSGALLLGGNNAPAIVKGSPAEKAGLKENDIITAINNVKISEQKSLTRIISQYNVGDIVELTIVRDKKESKIKVVLEELK